MKAAYFREEWLDKATQLLSNPADRALFYEMLMQRAFGRQVVQCNNPVVVAMYTMAESAIVADIAKYEAKCERNRQNAKGRSQSQPVAPSGSQSLPVAPTGSQSQRSTSTSTSTNTSTNTNTSTTSLEVDSEEREIFLIYSTLFTRGAIDLQSEFDSFYNYYSALGWKNNKGATIVSKVSAAAMWRMNGEVASNIAERQAWAKAFKTAPTTSPLVWTCFKSMKVDESEECRTLRIYTSLTRQQIESLEIKCERALRTLMAMYQCSEIEYHYQCS